MSILPAAPFSPVHYLASILESSKVLLWKKSTVIGSAPCFLYILCSCNSRIIIKAKYLHMFDSCLFSHGLLTSVYSLLLVSGSVYHYCWVLCVHVEDYLCAVWTDCQREPVMSICCWFPETSGHEYFLLVPWDFRTWVFSAGSLRLLDMSIFCWFPETFGHEYFLLVPWNFWTWAFSAGSLRRLDMSIFCWFPGTFGYEYFLLVPWDFWTWVFSAGSLRLLDMSIFCWFPETFGHEYFLLVPWDFWT